MHKFCNLQDLEPCVIQHYSYLPPTIQFERMWQYNLMVENLLHADLYKRQECESPDWSFAHQFPSTTLLPQPVLTGLWCKVWWCDPKNQIPTNKTEEWRSVDSEFTKKFLLFKASKQFFQIRWTFCQMEFFKTGTIWQPVVFRKQKVGNTDFKLLVAAMDKCNIIFTNFFFLRNLTWRLAVSLKGKNFAALGHADMLFCREF